MALRRDPLVHNGVVLIVNCETSHQPSMSPLPFALSELVVFWDNSKPRTREPGLLCLQLPIPEAAPPSPERRDRLQAFSTPFSKSMPLDSEASSDQVFEGRDSRDSE